MRLRIPEEELLTHFTDPRKQHCAFDKLEIEFSWRFFHLCQTYNSSNLFF